MTIVIVNWLATILCACAMTCWAVALLEGRRRRRELRDKVGNIVSTYYWPVEGEVSRLLREVETMRSTTLFRDITAFDVLAYKYRFRRQPLDDSSPIPNPASDRHTPSAIQTLRRVERLLDSLTLQVPARGRCPERVATPFGRTLCGLACATATVWSDEQAPTVSRLVRFFGGPEAAAEFDAARSSDVILEQRVESRVPYVDALRLSGDHFVLADLELTSDIGAFDVRAKVRYVDERLTEADARVWAARHWRQVLGAYRAACDLCVRAGLVQTLPEFSAETATDDARVGECVTVLRHLVRLMCGVEDSANRLVSDDQFLRFLAALHDEVYGWNGDAASSSSTLACIERSRANIVTYARALTVDQIYIEPDLTRAVLERVEAELYRHLDYLTVRRVRMTHRMDTTYQGLSEGPLMLLPGTSAAASEGRQLEEGTLHPGDSESSIYTMAASYMSPPRRQAAAVSASPKRFDPLLGGCSAERMSLLSGASSLYATAASLSSATNDGDSAGAASTRLSPGMSRYSPPHAAAAGRAAAAGTAALDSDGDGDYFETPV